jgi:hypothetical protein
LHLDIAPQGITTGVVATTKSLWMRNSFTRQKPLEVFTQCDASDKEYAAWEVKRQKMKSDNLIHETTEPPAQELAEHKTMDPELRLVRCHTGS